MQAHSTQVRSDWSMPRCHQAGRSMAAHRHWLQLITARAQCMLACIFIAFAMQLETALHRAFKTSDTCWPAWIPCAARLQ